MTNSKPKELQEIHFLKVTSILGINFHKYINIYALSLMWHQTFAHLIWGTWSWLPQNVYGDGFVTCLQGVSFMWKVLISCICLHNKQKQKHWYKSKHTLKHSWINPLMRVHLYIYLEYKNEYFKDSGQSLTSVENYQNV